MGGDPADNEERYQNQVNMPQPMYLGDNLYKKYGQGYENEEENNDDPHGYYDDNPEEFENNPRGRREEDYGEKNQNVRAPPVLGGELDNVKPANHRLPEQNAFQEEKLEEQLDLERFEGHDRQIDDDPGYGYYDEHENRGEPADKVDKESHNEKSKELLTEQLNSSTLTLVQSYFILLVAMVGLLAFMYRFVRKRRIVIRYR